MDARPKDRSPTTLSRNAECDRRHGIGAAWLVACIAHDAFQEGDVEWLMEIAARRCGDLPDSDG
jgi:hypothetical protein